MASHLGSLYPSGPLFIPFLHAAARVTVYGGGPCSNLHCLFLIRKRDPNPQHSPRPVWSMLPPTLFTLTLGPTVWACLTSFRAQQVSERPLHILILLPGMLLPLTYLPSPVGSRNLPLPPPIIPSFLSKAALHGTVRLSSTSRPLVHNHTLMWVLISLILALSCTLRENGDMSGFAQLHILSAEPARCLARIKHSINMCGVNE